MKNAFLLLAAVTRAIPPPPSRHHTLYVHPVSHELILCLTLREPLTHHGVCYGDMGIPEAWWDRDVDLIADDVFVEMKRRETLPHFPYSMRIAPLKPTL
jgi:hypothetical protein